MLCRTHSHLRNERSALGTLSLVDHQNEDPCPYTCRDISGTRGPSVLRLQLARERGERNGEREDVRARMALRLVARPDHQNWD
jgi:hypothetical protein